MIRTILILLIAFFAVGYSQAATVTIDFGSEVNFPFEPGETYSEDGFTLSVISGERFSIAGSVDGSGLRIGNSGSSTGVASFALDDGGLFTFDAYSALRLNSGPLLDLTFVGLVNGVITEMATFDVGIGILPMFTAAIDELRIEFSASDTAPPFGIDDFVFTSVSEVPLPAAAWVFLAGLGGLGVTRRRKKGA